MKKCSLCKELKQSTEFYEKSDRKTGGHCCKKCFNNYCLDRWRKRKVEAIVYKGSCCERCKIEYPKFDACIFDFHHKDPKQKDVSWNKLRLRSWDKIVLELDKCSLVCANCHRLIHKERHQQDSNLQPTA